MADLVSYQLDGPIAAITMDDGKVNVLSPAMLGELNAAFDQAAAEDAAVVLTGRPGVFSAGFDLSVLRAGGPASVGMFRAGFELSARVLSYPAPVLIACTGHAIAMGLFLLLSGDYRIGPAGPYKFTANEVALGMPLPRAAIEICRQRLTPAYLVRALILAEVLPPEAAVTAGILDQVVPDGEVAGAAAALAAGLAGLDRKAHAMTKLRARDQALATIRAAIDADYPASRA